MSVGRFTVLASLGPTTLMVPAVSGSWWGPQATTSPSTLGTSVCRTRQLALQTTWKSESPMLQVNFSEASVSEKNPSRSGHVLLGC